MRAGAGTSLRHQESYTFTDGIRIKLFDILLLYRHVVVYVIWHMTNRVAVRDNNYTNHYRTEGFRIRFTTNRRARVGCNLKMDVYMRIYKRIGGNASYLIIYFITSYSPVEQRLRFRSMCLPLRPQRIIIN